MSKGTVNLLVIIHPNIFVSFFNVEKILSEYGHNIVRELIAC